MFLSFYFFYILNNIVLRNQFKSKMDLVAILRFVYDMLYLVHYKTVI